jgi:hypothetical protein
VITVMAAAASSTATFIFFHRTFADFMVQGPPHTPMLILSTVNSLQQKQRRRKSLVCFPKVLQYMANYA